VELVERDGLRLIADRLKVVSRLARSARNSSSRARPTQSSLSVSGARPSRPSNGGSKLAAHSPR